MKIESIICLDNNILMISHTSLKRYELTLVDTLGIVYKHQGIFLTLESAVVEARRLIEFITNN